MKKYNTTTDMWLKGLLIEAGSEISLSDSEAKYLMHALEIVVEEPKKKPATKAGDKAMAGASTEV